MRGELKIVLSASRRTDIPAFYSDWFMNQTKKEPGASCYNWIKMNWPEAKYIGTFLAQLERSK